MFSKYTYSEASYDWRKIRHFFPWHNQLSGKYYYVGIYEDGQVIIRRMRTAKDYNDFAESCKQWYNTLKSEMNPTYFEYSAWSILQEYTNKTRTIIGLLLTFSYILVLLKPIVALISLTALSFLVLLKSWSVPKDYYRISIIGETLRVNFIDGSTIELLLEDVIRFRFDWKVGNSRIFFKDGTKLVHLERLSYWPILREQLLLKLEPVVKNNQQKN